MRAKNLIIAIVLVLSSLAGAAYHGTAGTPGEYTLEQFGCTWTFQLPIRTDAADAGHYQYGQYANGDYWVYSSTGSVTITTIDPAKTTTNQVEQDGVTRGPYTVDGSQVDPSNLGIGPDATGTKQGFDSRVTFWNDSVSVTAPLTLTGLHSLMTSKSYRVGDVGWPGWYASTISNSMYHCPRPAVVYTAILTTVASVPSAGSFRPAYCGTTTKITTHNTSQMSLALLPSVALVGTPPIADTTFNTNGSIKVRGWKEYMRRPWIQFLTAWPGECLAAVENGTIGYGFDYANRISNVCMLLALTPDAGTITTAERQTLAIQLIQVGIDTWGIIANGGGWGHIGAGIAQGRKLPVLFAGMALNYDTYKNVGTTHGYNADPALNYVYFQEDAQKFTILQSDINTWGGAATNSPYCATRTNCSVDVSDPTILIDNNPSGNWVLSDDGTHLIKTRDMNNSDMFLVWNYGGSAPEYVRVYQVNWKDPATNLYIGTNKMKLRDPVTPGTGRTARVQLIPQGRLGYPDWSCQDHWTHPQGSTSIQIGDIQDRTYRTCCSSSSLSNIQLFALMVPGMKTLWNRDVFFDYEDYYMIDTLSGYWPSASQRGTAWEKAMWDAYRPNYGDLWLEPTIGQIGNKTAKDGVELSFTVSDNDGSPDGTKDINGDALAFTIDAASMAKGMSIVSGTGVFTWTPTEDGKQEGEHSVYFTVTNASGRVIHQGITISAEPPPGEAHNPVLNGSGTDGAVPTQVMTLNVNGSTELLAFSDEDGGTLTVTSTTLPPGLTLSATDKNCWIHGAPTNPGNFSVTVTVHDTTARTASRIFTIQVVTTEQTYYIPWMKT
jgi:hypothetical protein